MATAVRDRSKHGGVVTPGFEPLAEAFKKAMGRGPRGGALVVRRGDEVLADLSIGYADRARSRPWEDGTQVLGFSATKGLASMVLHRLADRGLLDYDASVAEYWPAFGAEGKGGTTVRELLSHRAGLYDVQAVSSGAESLLDAQGMEASLARARARGPVGAPAYHAITYGWLASGLARAITGKGMGELAKEELVGPLEAPGLEIGNPSTQPAEILGSSLRLYSSLGIAFSPLLGWLPITRGGFRALHAPGFESLMRGPEPKIWDTEMPAVNGALSADSLSRLYAPLANGGLAPNGERFLSEETVDKAGRIQTRGMDRVLGVRMRWRLGFHHGFGTGTRAPRALGHFGFGGCGGWGDPDTGVSFGFVSNDIGRFTTVLGDITILRLSGVTRTCAREAFEES